MAKIEGEITIRRPVEEVFDYVADQTNEPRYNLEMVTEYTRYDRPKQLASTTTIRHARSRTSGYIFPAGWPATDW